MKSALWVCVLLLFISVSATAGDEVLSVTGSGEPGTAMMFKVTTKTSNPHRIAFLGVSPMLGKTEFNFVTLGLGMPILAYGMGSLNKGTVKRKLEVPTFWAPKMVFTYYAQAVVVTPKGGGYIATTTNIVKFLINT